MGRLPKALGVLLVVDGLLYAAMLGILQLLPAVSLCERMELNISNCAQPYSLSDLVGCLNALVAGVVICAALATATWIAGAYLFGDSGTPEGLRRKGVIWWVMATVGVIGTAIFGYYRAAALDALNPNGVVGSSLTCAVLGLTTYFLTSVFATPWVIRGQVPGAQWIAGRLYFP